MGVGAQRHPSATLPPGMIRYPSYRMLGGSQGRSGRVRRNSPPPGFDPRTVQPVASRNTDWAIPAHSAYSCAVWISYRSKYGEYRRMRCNVVQSGSVSKFGLEYNDLTWTEGLSTSLRNAGTCRINHHGHVPGHIAVNLSFLQASRMDQFGIGLDKFLKRFLCVFA